MNKKELPLVLGTAQFGFLYGVANKTGQPDQATVTEIVRVAWEKGIREFDTAQDYGVSEHVLGQAFAKLGIASKVKVISKLNPTLDYRNAQVLSRALDSSLSKLGVPCLAGLMLHREEDLAQWPQGLGDILQGFVKSGKVKSLGVSAYSPDGAMGALNIKGLDMIQVPSNILDQRFEKQGIFILAAKNKKQVYIRSVFLQGLLLLDPDAIPEKMTFAREEVRKVQILAARAGLSVKQVCLGYVLSKWPQAKVLLGVETPEQIRDNMDLISKNFSQELVHQADAVMGLVEDRIVDPRLWAQA